ncbi:hypothetical protein BDY19DRAFT_301675 [Irpex rosettiformis]|uniref:Uncharacterized protein n=1 Tax=Irpex rosettiformis TaxID=378272 RepID=A0ACB8TYL9_9APHY|nr:hypothetical protein BDY19DRAFT_301675 [Irpex rosettiformis]
MSWNKQPNFRTMLSHLLCIFILSESLVTGPKLYLSRERGVCISTTTVSKGIYLKPSHSEPLRWFYAGTTSSITSPGYPSNSMNIGVLACVSTSSPEATWPKHACTIRSRLQELQPLNTSMSL